MTEKSVRIWLGCEQFYMEHFIQRDEYDMKTIGKLSKILSFPAGYQLFQRMVGAESARKTYLAEYVKPAPGKKILDIGCGPADILNYLPVVNYTGLDVSPEYIRSAEKNFGAKGRFCCGDVGLATIDGEQGTFDLVMAIGVIHHLNDAQAAKLFELARRALSSKRTFSF